MTDRKATGKSPESDRKGTGTEPESVSLSEAATRLGIGYDTARKRLKNGSLKGFKGGNGEWRVVLPPDRNTIGNRPETDRKDSGSVVAVLLTEVAFLRSQIQAKDSQLAARDEEIRRTHVLLQQAQQQVAASLPPPSRRPWWRRWLGKA